MLHHTLKEFLIIINTSARPAQQKKNAPTIKKQKLAAFLGLCGDPLISLTSPPIADDGNQLIEKVSHSAADCSRNQVDSRLMLCQNNKWPRDDDVLRVVSFWRTTPFGNDLETDLFASCLPGQFAWLVG